MDQDADFPDYWILFLLIPSTFIKQSIFGDVQYHNTFPSKFFMFKKECRKLNPGYFKENEGNRAPVSMECRNWGLVQWKRAQEVVFWQVIRHCGNQGPNELEGSEAKLCLMIPSLGISEWAVIRVLLYSKRKNKFSSKSRKVKLLSHSTTIRLMKAGS